MGKKSEESRAADLPPCATEFIGRVVRRMWYRRRARREVRAELTAHFEDALRDCATAEEKERKAREVIEEFGDARLLAVLCHRAKKRCRPLWLKVLLRSAQGVGLIGLAYLYLILCTLPMMLGRPTIRVNYAEWLNSHWRPEVPSVENAKIHYDQAVALYVKPPQELEEKLRLRRWVWMGYSPGDIDLIDRWLAQNQAAFDVLRRGANTRFYWPVYDINGSSPFEFGGVQEDMKTVEQYRHPIAFAFQQQIVRKAHRGQGADALDDCLVLRRFGRHLQDKGGLISQMHGIAIERLGYDGITALMQQPDLSAAVLERTQEELGADFDLHRQVISLDGERGLWYSTIQRSFTDDGQGGGHPLPQGIPYAAGDWRWNLINMLRFHYPDRRMTVAMVEQYFRQAQERLDEFPGIESHKESNDPMRASTLSVMLLIATPTYEGAGALAWRLKTHEIATITLLALRRYFQASGSYPESLDQLAERGFLKEMPKDPFGPGPLTYRKTDTGFFLYSWGEDRKDGGGQLGTDSQGQPRNWAANGDWVFWPVPEL